MLAIMCRGYKVVVEEMHTSRHLAINKTYKMLQDRSNSQTLDIKISNLVNNMECKAINFMVRQTISMGNIIDSHSEAEEE